MKNKPVFQNINYKWAFFCGLGLFAALFIFKPTKPTIVEQKPTFSENFEFNEKLQTEAGALLPLFNQMPPVPVYLKDEPVLKSGVNTERGVAYTNCDNFESPVIFVKKTFYQKANPKQLTNILKHELTHAFLCRQGQMWGHDELFRRKFKEVGGFGN